MSNRSIILIFFLCLVIMPLAFSIYSLIEIKVIEHRMQERMEVENLQVIAVDAASVIWLKKNKEILIDGEPFDIKNIIHKGNKLILSGLFDSKEKELGNRMEAYHTAGGKSETANHSLLLLFFTPCYEANSMANLTTPFLVNKKQAQLLKQDKIISLYYDIVTPPPRFI
jgi:hypothetical protein